MLKPFLVVVFFLVGAAAVILGIDLRTNDYGTTTLKGKPAPAFTLSTPDGKTVSLADMKGKVVLIDIWATWCPPCRASLPGIQKLSTNSALAEKGLVVWAVNNAESKSDIEAFLKENNFTFTVPMDETGAMEKAYLVSGIPTTVLVGRDGTVKDAFIGYSAAIGREMDAAVERALAEPR